jgi:DNA repair protein RadA
MGEEEFEDPLLRIKGMTPELARAFKEAGYYTIESIGTEVPHMLVQRVGERYISLELAKKLIKEARDLLPIKIMTVAELLEQEKRRKTISTGSKKLDELLGGGIHTHELTEAVGPAEAGKTELVYTSAVNAVKTLGAVWIIDTEATLSAHRLTQIGQHRGLDVKELTSQIIFDRCLTSAELILALENAHKIIKDFGVKYIAIDSFASPFRRDYPGRELLAQRQQKINYCINLLLKYSWAYELAVLATNQVQARPEAQFTTRPELINPPIGGHVVYHGFNNRIYMEQTSDPYVWRATLIASSYLPRGQAPFKITVRGIEDISEETAQKKPEIEKEAKSA